MKYNKMLALIAASQMLQLQQMNCLADCVRGEDKLCEPPSSPYMVECSGGEGGYYFVEATILGVMGSYVKLWQHQNVGTDSYVGYYMTCEMGISWECDGTQDMDTITWLQQTFSIFGERCYIV